MQLRELTPNERALIDVLLRADFPGAAELRAQLEGIQAAATNDHDNYGSVYLHPRKGTAAAPGRFRVPVEGRWRDSDAGTVSILLHVIDGRLNELEIIKDDGSALLDDIVASEIEVIVV
jgi:hypothetical protein